VHAHASLHLFPLALPGLRLTSILPSTPPESYLSRPKQEVLPEKTDRLQYKHK